MCECFRGFTLGCKNNTEVIQTIWLQLLETFTHLTTKMNTVGCFQQSKTTGNSSVKCFAVLVKKKKKNLNVKVLSLEICINVALLFLSVDTFFGSFCG